VKREEYDPWFPAAANSGDTCSTGPSRSSSAERSFSRGERLAGDQIVPVESAKAAKLTGHRVDLTRPSRRTPSRSWKMDDLPSTLQSSWQSTSIIPHTISIHDDDAYLSEPGSHRSSQAHLIWDASADHNPNLPLHVGAAMPSSELVHRVQAQLPTPPLSMDAIPGELASIGRGSGKGKEKEHEAFVKGYGAGLGGKAVSGIDPMPSAVWAAVMDTSKGRDKVLVSVPTTSVKSPLGVQGQQVHSQTSF
jgi:hypothetical protein